MDRSSAIGVFDSGMGGLTVLRALHRMLPTESFIYLGDTARLPYGTKSLETVQHYAEQMARILVEHRVKAIVIACNTATTAALSYLQTLLPDIVVMGVVIPGAEAAISATRNQRIAVLATETTIASQAYQLIINNQLPNSHVSTRSCSLLVALAEEGMVDNAITRLTLAHYLSDLKDEDTLLLGCTHFPVFTSLLESLVPPSMTIVDSAQATASQLRRLLLANNLLTNADKPRDTRYLVTDSVTRFQKVGATFLGKSLASTTITLVDGF